MADSEPGRGAVCAAQLTMCRSELVLPVWTLKRFSYCSGLSDPSFSGSGGSLADIIDALIMHLGMLNVIHFGLVWA